MDALPTTIWVKVECFNPGGSVKDQIALAMIEDADITEPYRRLMAGHNRVVVMRNASPCGFLSRIDLADFWTEQTQEKGKK